MHSVVVAFLGLLSLIGAASAKDGEDKFDVGKYDKNRNGRIELPAETDIIQIHQRHPVLAACDGGKGGNFNGKLDKSELQCANDFFSKSINRARADVSSHDPDKDGFSYDEAKAVLGKPKKEDDLVLPFLVRDVYSPISVNARKKLDPQSEVGARIAYTHNYDNKDSAYNLSGALLFPFETGIGDKDITKRKPTVAELLVIPAVEFNRVTHTQTPTKDVNYLGFHLGSEALLQYFPIFPTQYVRLGGYYKTDFDGETQIPGGYAEWQPYFLTYGISAPKTIPGTPINYTIIPTLRTEVEHVVRIGSSRGVTSGTDYFRGGGVIEGKLWFDEGPLDRFSFHAKYWRLTDFRQTQESDRRYFQADMLYSLDPKGYFSIDLRYRKGDEPALGIPVHDLTAGLSIKY